ncbi:hypothetical protein N7495_003445 [Penicillium taxi]|uniref:uncharacterized protein n=1 Tax=Penicillium taxi TaxID=168475 RepID=UPI0025459D03|nr:uncharacterized protein N7495_003445 [Penicillium taxi]KAJ5902917.1 hypothetical protein N7495_003445 [Penicillium taxi]
MNSVNNTVREEDQVDERNLLREKYKRAVSELLEELKSKPKSAYTSDDISSIGVSLELFNPNDSNFTESKVCFFKPFQLDEFRKFYGELYDDDDIYHEVDEIYHNITIRSTTAQKGSSLDSPLSSMLESSRRTRVEFRIRDDISTYYAHPKHCIRAIPDEMLFNELFCAAQAIKNRMNQEEFKDTSLFPLGVSPFGFCTLTLACPSDQLRQVRPGNEDDSHLEAAKYVPVLVFNQEGVPPEDTSSPKSYH